MSEGDHADDHQHRAAPHTQEDQDELFTAPQQAAPEELGWRSLEPAALVLASRQRRLESGLIVAQLRGFALLRLKLRFTLVLFLEPSHHFAPAVALFGWCAVAV